MSTNTNNQVSSIRAPIERAAPPRNPGAPTIITVARRGRSALAGLKGDYAEHLALLLAGQFMEGRRLLNARQGGLDGPAGASDSAAVTT